MDGFWKKSHRPWYFYFEEMFLLRVGFNSQPDSKKLFEKHNPFVAIDRFWFNKRCPKLLFKNQLLIELHTSAPSLHFLCRLPLQKRNKEKSTRLICLHLALSSTCFDSLQNPISIIRDSYIRPAVKYDKIKRWVIGNSPCSEYSCTSAIIIVKVSDWRV